MELRDQLTITSNEHQLYIFSLDELLKEAQYRQQKFSTSFTADDIKAIAGQYSTVTDLLLVKKIIQELGLTGEVVEKTVNGKTYIILKGRAGLRQTLKGTRYLANHPSVVKLALGHTNTIKNVTRGAVVTIFITIPLSIADLIIRDAVTMGGLIGTIASDLAKILISATASSLAAFAVGAVTTIAAGPLIAAIFVGVGISYSLDSLDKKYDITNRLIKAIDNEINSLYDNTFGELARGIRKIEAILEYQIMHGLPVGKGVFY